MVVWNAQLEVRFPDYQDQMKVTVDNFSGIEAVLHADQVLLNGRYLTAGKAAPELNMKIFLPEGILESDVEIRWYRWSVKKSLYEVGVRFVNILKENQSFVDKIIRRLHCEHRYC